MQQFLEQLLATGEVTVPAAGGEFDPAPFDDALLQFDRAARLSMAGDAPKLEKDVAAWAAMLLAASIRLLVVRELGVEEIERAFHVSPPKPRTSGRPEVDYSADLFLRYLPNLAKFVKLLSAEDPLLKKIRGIAEAWPLSSVGMQDFSLTPAPVDSFVAHAGLRQLYVDRIFATGDLGRINHPAIAATILASLGAHPELSPEIAKAAREIAGKTSE